jgi:5-methyltetrahydrofolate--homocysteine methyltransferase
MEGILKKLQDAMYAGNKIEVERLAREALSGGIEPLKVLEEGMRPGLSRVGDAFEAGDLFLPELVGAGDAALAVSNIIEEALGEGEEIPRKGTIAVGTVKGDIHSIGKGMVITMMRVNGFKVIDLGVDVSPEEFLEVADKVEAIGLSSLISLSTKSMEETIKKVSSKYPDVVIIIGGAAVDPALAKAFGVLYGADAASAPRIVEENLKQREQ